MHSQKDLCSRGRSSLGWEKGKDEDRSLINRFLWGLARYGCRGIKRSKGRGSAVEQEGMALSIQWRGHHNKWREAGFDQELVKGHENGSGKLQGDGKSISIINV